MSSINFPGGGGGAGGTITQVSGLPTASGDLYVLRDGTRFLTGNIVPDSHNAQAIGVSGQHFGSGVFRQALLIGNNIRLESRLGIDTSDKGGLVILDNATYPVITYRSIRADQFHSNPASAILYNDSILMGNASLISWVNDILPTATMEVNINRKFAGMARVSTTATGVVGGVSALSGIFHSGIVLIAPNGSGWLVTLDSNNNLTTSGPLVV